MDSRCPSCDTPLGLFPPREALRHANECLDAAAAATIANGTSCNDADVFVADGSRDIFNDCVPVCGICQRDLSSLTHSARLAHANRCVDATLAVRRSRRRQRPGLGSSSTIGKKEVTRRGSRTSTIREAERKLSELCPAVARLLQLVSLERYARRFAEHEIDLDVLQNLGEDDWPVLRLPESALRRIQDALVDAHLLRQVALSGRARKRNIFTGGHENVLDFQKDDLSPSLQAGIGERLLDDTTGNSAEDCKGDEFMSSPIVQTQPLAASSLGRSMGANRSLFLLHDDDDDDDDDNDDNDDNDNLSVLDINLAATGVDRGMNSLIQTRGALATGTNEKYSTRDNVVEGSVLECLRGPNTSMERFPAKNKGDRSQRRGYTQLEELIEEAEAVAVDGVELVDREELQDLPCFSQHDNCLGQRQCNRELDPGKEQTQVVIDLDGSSSDDSEHYFIVQRDSARVQPCSVSNNDVSLHESLNSDARQNHVDNAADESTGKQHSVIEDKVLSPTILLPNAQCRGDDGGASQNLSECLDGRDGVRLASLPQFSDYAVQSPKFSHLLHNPVESARGFVAIREHKGYKEDGWQSKCPMDSLSAIETWYEAQCERERVRYETRMKCLREDVERARDSFLSRKRGLMAAGVSARDMQYVSASASNGLRSSSSLSLNIRDDERCGDVVHNEQTLQACSSDSGDDDDLIRSRIRRLSARHVKSGGRGMRPFQDTVVESDGKSSTQNCHENAENTVNNSTDKGKQLSTRSKSSKFAQAQKPFCRTTALDETLIRAIREHPEIYDQIVVMDPVRYEDISRIVQDSGLRVGVSKLTDFLDRQGVSYKAPEKDVNKSSKEYLRQLNSQQ